jgi:hypothetical protein
MAIRIHRRAESRTDSAATRFIAPAVAATTVLAGVVGLLVKSREMVAQIESSFLLTCTVVWVLTLFFTVRSTALTLRARRFTSMPRVFIAGTVTALYLAIIAWAAYEFRFRETGPADTDHILGALYSLISTPAYAQTPSLSIVSFQLDEDASSFIESDEPLFGASARRYRTFSYDRDIAAQFAQGRCVGVRGEQPIRDAFGVLRRLAGSKDATLANYLRNPDDLSRIVRTRGDVFERIMPSPAELEGLRKDKAPDYNAIREWLVRCVGIRNPVFTVTVANRGPAPLRLTRVTYRVADVGEVKGDAPDGAILPDILYDHPLDHEVGEQSHDLDPVFVIAPGNTRAFQIRLRPQRRQPGQAWLLSVKLVAAEGPSAETQQFQLVMGK